MSDSPNSTDWATSRGEKWLAQLEPMEAMLAVVTEPLIAALMLDHSCRIADIGCGGGGTTLAIAQQAPQGSTVVGLDISPALIAAARMRPVPAGRHLSFEVADMGTARTPQPFDRLASRFGVMFFEDPSAAFANVARWLAPGGRFAFAVWGPPVNNPWMMAVRTTIAEIIDLPTPDPDAPGPFRYGDVDKLITLLQDTGFARVEATPWLGKIAMAGGVGAGEAAEFALTAFSLGDLLAEAGDGALTRATESLTTHYADHLVDGAVTMDAHVHLVTGTTAP